jgi:hypothetical protein
MPQGVSVATIDRLRLIASGGDPAQKLSPANGA